MERMRKLPLMTLVLTRAAQPMRWVMSIVRSTRPRAPPRASIAAIIPHRKSSEEGVRPGPQPAIAPAAAEISTICPVCSASKRRRTRGSRKAV